MKIAITILGVVVGALIEDWPGAIVGGIGGFALALIIEFAFRQKREEWIQELTKIEQEFNAQRARIEALEATSAQPVGTAPIGQRPIPAETIPVSPPEEISMSAAVSKPAMTRAPEPSPVITKEKPQVAPPRVSKPARPNALWNWLFGGNAMVRVGIVVLFFGVAFLIKYAAEHVTLPVELRLSGIALGAIVLLVLGWRLRHRRGAYGLLLQGGGIGILYLVIFGAFRIWGVLPGGFTLVLLLAIGVFSAMLAILQNAPALAVAGVSGGFLAPILASTGGGSHVALFSYYLILNLGLFAIAWFKAWRVLNLVGFVFTFAIGALWGAQFYRPEFLASTEPFLMAFFLLYVGIAILFALRRATVLKDYVDSTLVFGTPVVSFALQLALLAEYEYGAAWAAVGMAVFYVLAAQILWRLKRASLQLLLECFVALSIGFATLAIPLALDAIWTSAIWAVEGLGAIWMGARQGRRLPRAFGVLLQFAAGIAFLDALHTVGRDWPLFNGHCLGALMIGGSGLIAARMLQREPEANALKFQHALAALLLIWGALWWLAGGFEEIDFWLSGARETHAILAYCAFSAALLGWAGNRWQWDLPRLGTFALLPALLFCAVIDLMGSAHPLAVYGWLAWPFAFAVLYFLLRKHEDIAPARSVALYHCVALWLGVFLLAWECGMRIEDWVGGGRIWSMVAWPLLPALAVLVLSARGERYWPFSRHLETYLVAGSAPMLVFMYAWVWYANFNSNGDPSPLPYLPLLNPLDLCVSFLVVIGFLWARAVRENTSHDFAQWREFFLPALGAVAFVWANGILLRSLHHYAEVPFALDAMLRSTLVQTAFSVFWTLLALGAMLSAHWKRHRALWVIGAVLLAVVVVKLFFIDLSRIAGVERIVSFIGVGVLMLIIGFFVPVPPRQKESLR